MPSTYQHILVALDLSSESNIVLEKAKGIAEAFNAHLSVVHIVEPLTLAYSGDIPLDLTEAQATMEAHAKSRLHKIIDDNSLSVRNQIVAIGATSNELHRLADELDADLILVGSHGRHGLATLFGSTASGVIQGAKQDVLAVKV